MDQNGQCVEKCENFPLFCKPCGDINKYKMTDLEIQKYIEDHLRNCQGGKMMDEQVFYEGAKWYRDYIQNPELIQRTDQPPE